MSYCRFIEGDAYVFRTFDDRLCCCGCIFGNEQMFDTEQAMLDHLAAHTAAGHDIPADAIERLTEERDATARANPEREDRA
jgi:hypothetical protein